MRTFIIRARKGTTRWDKLRSQVGSQDHIEVIAHTVMNAFFIASGFREDVELYIVLESTEDFPRTLKLSANEGLSLAGFHEEAVISLMEHALKKSQHLEKNQTQQIAPGVQISGFGFEKLVQRLLPERTLYLLEPKGENIRDIDLAPNPVFILSDHLAMPKKNMAALKRQGLKTLALGKQMLFASQCLVLIQHEIDSRMQ